MASNILFYGVHGVIFDTNIFRLLHFLLLADLVLEELHISNKVFPEVPVEGVPVGGDDLALETGVH